jgi:hypothetical protein
LWEEKVWEIGRQEMGTVCAGREDLEERLRGKWGNEEKPWKLNRGEGESMLKDWQEIKVEGGNGRDEGGLWESMPSDVVAQFEDHLISTTKAPAMGLGIHWSYQHFKRFISAQTELPQHLNPTTGNGVPTVPLQSSRQGPGKAEQTDPPATARPCRPLSNT